MRALIDTVVQKSSRAFLVGVEMKAHSAWDVQDSLDELSELATTAGLEVAERGTQKLEKPHSATYIGPGKAKEFAARGKELGVDVVIFDDELSPGQGRTLEELFGCRVTDRTGLILDIFGQRARTREGKLQVELAQLQYLLPRLTRFWSHLSRQRGSTGSIGGEGESQLEADRRKTQERIDKIKSELEIVQRQRLTQRAGRQRSQWPLASIVGYTNAGKSTLLNRITGASTLAEDKLFATLDPTTRRLRLPTNQNVLISDTVGFIRKLPHNLVEAFKATLEEVIQADLLLHVVDLSHPGAEEQILAVNQVLEELDAADKQTMMVFNKVDRLSEREVAARFRERFPNSVFISAKSGEGLDTLMAEIGAQLRPVREFLELAVPYADSAVMARLHEVGQVVESKFNGAKARFKVRIPPHLHAEFERYVTKDLTQA